MDPAIITVLVILISTVVMLVCDVFRIDVVAIICMLALGWTGVLTPQEALSGFSSNAVIAMMAVMILGQGIASTGIMDRFSGAIVKRVGTRRSRVVGVMFLSVGMLSGLIQNIGATALFLPGILNISRRGKIPPSVLVMPIGFAAIVGGMLSMVGSGPLILINDLLRSANLSPYGLFSVTPVGIVLLLATTGYFFFFGRFVLPHAESPKESVSEQEKLVSALRLPHTISHYTIPPGSPLAGKTTEQSGAWGKFNLNILGIFQGGEATYAPGRDAKFEVGQDLSLLGSEQHVKEFASAYHLQHQENFDRISSLNDPELAVEPIMMFSQGEEVRGDFSDRPIFTGDTIIVYGLWDIINDLKMNSNFLVATPFRFEKKKNPSKFWSAALCFLGAIGLATTGAPISLAFLTGAIAMVLMRVLAIQEAYQAIEWKVVFLLAGLIPLGVAMQKTGTADFLAEKVMVLVQGGHPVLTLLTVGILSTLFSLFMSNVGAIVVLAPLVISMADIGGLDPRPLALLAAVCAANSFLLPTHQVNAFLMSSGGYRNADYFKAGGGMTLLFLMVVVPVFYLFYL